jgi:hypothetical protein
MHSEYREVRTARVGVLREVSPDAGFNGWI